MFRLAAGAAVHRLPTARRRLRTSGSSALTLEPLAEALRHGGQSGIRPVDRALVARPGLQLRLAVVALRAGVLRYVTEDGTIVESDARTPAAGPAAGPVDLIEGALASASVPLVFPPRHLADDDYVDGGVLQIIPVRAAAQLGATRIIAVVAMPLALAREERNFTESRAANVGIRAMGVIGMAERQRENLATVLPEGVTLTTIDPIVDVVGLFEVQPGLLRINKDYGWLRAADILAPGDPTLVAEVAAQTHQLIGARLQAWHLDEETSVGFGATHARRPRTDAGTLAPAAPAASSEIRSPGRPNVASSWASRCPMAVKRGGRTTRCTARTPTRSAAPLRRNPGSAVGLRPVGPPSQPRRRNRA